MVPFIEPFPRLMNQGQVIYGGASMSKSQGQRRRADAARRAVGGRQRSGSSMLFASPFEDDIDWQLIAGDSDRRPGVHHWLGRVFAAVGEAAEGGGEEPVELRPPDPPDDQGRDRATWSGSASTSRSRS